MPREIPVLLESGGRTTALLYPAERSNTPGAALILAHGAGSDQHHPFLVSVARGLTTAARSIDVMTFNFLYTEQRKRVPDRMPQLVACYRGVITAARDQLPSARERLFIGGKSMGGRAATHVVADDPDVPVKGICLLGYPLHPPGRPAQLRDAHLPAVGRPMLFIQGSRDAFGTPTELKPILDRLSPPPTLHIVEGGDHSFRIGGRGAKEKQAEVHAEIETAIFEWIDRL
jgi:predicted alpha/beta-hydrolase family hydrolase